MDTNRSVVPGHEPAEDFHGTGLDPAEGKPAEGGTPVGTLSPTGGRGYQHWAESSVRAPSLDDRGSLFFAAVEMTRMPMVLVDAQQRDMPIAFANGAFFDLTGYTMEEVYGRNCRFLQGALTDRNTINEVREALMDQRPVAVEILNYKKDGTPFWNALFIGPIFDKDTGKILYYFASQLDVTRRRNSEDSFRHAQKMEAIGQLTAGLAHDFNNALHVVLGNVRRVLDAEPELSERSKRSLSNALRAAEQSSKLTGQLLTFARKTRLEPEAVVLSSVLADFGDMLERTMTSLNIGYRLAPDLPPCMLDPTHMEMAVLNLISNSRDAMPGGGRVTVSTHLSPAHGDRPEEVVVEVCDDGPGMSPEVLGRCTEPFFTTKGEGKGTGLGLAMVYGFVRQSGGRLEINSGLGVGTRVKLFFPVCDPASALPPPPSSHDPVLSVAGGNRTIMVVEDVDPVRELAVEQLSALGYEVLQASSGEQAIEILKGMGGRVALLFSDIVMPGGMNGLVLAERARAEWPQLPVLLATGYNEAMTLPGHRNVYPVLSKPYGIATLSEQVALILNRAHVRGHTEHAG